MSVTVEFSDSIVLLPMPVSPGRAARQALMFRAWIAALGGVEAAKQAAVEAILDAPSDDTPSEVGRLRLLYRHAYTRQELEDLVTRTFAALGLTPL